jgi:hypothetical protein
VQVVKVSTGQVEGVEADKSRVQIGQRLFQRIVIANNQTDVQIFGNVRFEYPGGLVEVLDQFAVRGVNLTRLESRPTGDALGRYCFCLDAEGHVSDPRLGEALKAVRRLSRQVRFLGSFPRTAAAAVTSPPRPVATDTAFDAPEAWLQRLRGGAVG